MKKLLCLLVFCLLIGSTALAAPPQLSDSLFSSAKQAVGYLGSGEYERLVTLLPFSDVSPSASEWERFSLNYADLGKTQTEYAVAYWTGSYWKVAVPVHEPVDGSVEVLVLTSEDGVAFSGYCYATWGDVEGEYGRSDRVLWNREYVGGTPMIVAD